MRKDLVIEGERGVHDLETAVGHAEARGWGCPGGLGLFGVGMLGCEGAVFGDPGIKVS